MTGFREMRSDRLRALESLSPDEVARQGFSELVALVDEPNMPSGGATTLHDLLREVPWIVSGTPRLLEIGSNTGFTTLELASLMPSATCVGVDINAISVARASLKAVDRKLPNASFLIATAGSLPFGTGVFDLVFASNVTSFIDDKAGALDEYVRVCRSYGLLVVVPIFYVTEPPTNLQLDVERAIGARLTNLSCEDWIELVVRRGLTLLSRRDYSYVKQSSERIRAYANIVLGSDAHVGVPAATRTAAVERLVYFYELFDDNLTYANFSLLVFRHGAPTKADMLHETKRRS